jgi:hypothetical protein
LESQAVRLESRLRKLEAFIEKVRAAWLPPVNEVIAQEFGLTVEQVLALPVEEQQALADELARRIEESLYGPKVDP